MHSAERRLTVPLALGLSIALTGCVSTQTKNERLVLRNDRTVETEGSVRVAQINRAVAVIGIALVRGREGAVLVVSLRNGTDHPVSDLPISVGITPRHGPRRYLNDTANLGYFDTHLPGLAAGGTLIWVLPVGRLSLPAGRLFAKVGFARVPSSTSQRTLPWIVATPSAHRAGALAITVANRSAVPQQQLPVYAVASRAGRYVAAGRAIVGGLRGGARTTVRLHLVGRPTGARIELFAPPTIFR